MSSLKHRPLMHASWLCLLGWNILKYDTLDAKNREKLNTKRFLTYKVWFWHWDSKPECSLPRFWTLFWFAFTFFLLNCLVKERTCVTYCALLISNFFKMYAGCKFTSQIICRKMQNISILDVYRACAMCGFWCLIWSKATYIHTTLIQGKDTNPNTGVGYNPPSFSSRRYNVWIIHIFTN